jgi:hypothetical protein
MDGQNESQARRLKRDSAVPRKAKICVFVLAPIVVLTAIVLDILARHAIGPH